MNMNNENIPAPGFVAIRGNAGAFSENGINWMPITTPLEVSNLSASSHIVCGNGRYVTVRYNSDQGMYSDDGINWHVSTLPSVRNWTAVCYGNGRFVSIDSKADSLIHSVDGINWQDVPAPEFNFDYSAAYMSGQCEIGYGGGMYVILVKRAKKALYSEDAVTWHETTLPVTGNQDGWTRPAYGNGMFVSNGFWGNAIYSYDGITWRRSTVPPSQGIGGTRNMCPVTYGDGFFLCLDTDRDVLRSPDGINWSVVKKISMSQYLGTGHLAYHNGRILFVSNTTRVENAVFYTDDGINWKQTPFPYFKTTSSVCGTR